MCVLRALAALTSTAPYICSPAAVAAPRRQRALMLGTLACKAGAQSAIVSCTRPQRTAHAATKCTCAYFLLACNRCLLQLPAAAAACFANLKNKFQRSNWRPSWGERS